MHVTRSACLLLVFASLCRAAELRLTDCTPVRTEWGTESNGLYATWGMRVCEWGSAGNMGLHWPGESKTVGAIDPAYSLPEGKNYGSDATNAFAVGGEWMTGVGLWARRMSYYHWIEYDIPAGATNFTSQLFVTDDPRGYQWWAGANQQFTFEVLVDGQTRARAERTRTGLEYGSGELQSDFRVAIPAGARRIRFRVATSGWGDGNSNVELVLHEGRFEKP